MFDVGCVSTILQMLKLPDGTVKVLVEGQQRAQVNHRGWRNPFQRPTSPIEAPGRCAPQ
jgi:ATP-dependent Lon protease